MADDDASHGSASVSLQRPHPIMRQVESLFGQTKEAYRETLGGSETPEVIAIGAEEAQGRLWDDAPVSTATGTGTGFHGSGSGSGSGSGPEQAEAAAVGMPDWGPR